MCARNRCPTRPARLTAIARFFCQAYGRVNASHLHIILSSPPTGCSNKRYMEVSKNNIARKAYRIMLEGGNYSERLMSQIMNSQNPLQDLVLTKRGTRPSLARQHMQTSRRFMATLRSSALPRWAAQTSFRHSSGTHRRRPGRSRRRRGGGGASRCCSSSCCCDTAAVFCFSHSSHTLSPRVI